MTLTWNQPQSYPPLTNGNDLSKEKRSDRKLAELNKKNLARANLSEPFARQPT